MPAMPDALPPTMTLEEFLRWDDGTDQRYELIDGQPVAMTSPLTGHATLVPELARLIGNQIRRPFRVYVEVGILAHNRKDTWFQADLAVSCAPFENARWLRDPTLIVEVLSPSTLAHDRGLKAHEYRAIPGVQEVVLVASDRRHVQVMRRQAEGWLILDWIGEGTVPLESIGATLSLAELYEGLEF